MSKRVVFSVGFVICCALIVLFTGAPHENEPGLADSPWPMLYNNPQFTKVTSASGPVSVGTDSKWDQNHGTCWTTPHQGEGNPGFLYLVAKRANDEEPGANPKLYKLDPDTGLVDRQYCF